MIRVRTPSRLHFGLLSLPSEQPTPGRRNFGGVGLMIDKPGIELCVERAERFTATGPLAERAMHYARAFCDGASITDTLRVHVESAAPEHMGLGTGTQLGLTVARAIAELTQQPQRSATTLAMQIGRGQRSAIGVHGFEHGGFLVEAGKLDEHSISPLVVRQTFPPDWRVLLIFPREGHGMHGTDEFSAFAALKRGPCDERITEIMSRVVLLNMLPSLVEADRQAFGEAVYEYNRRAGEMFESAQGGIYANDWIEHTVKIVREMGVNGVGQSSWGPVVFAIVDRRNAEELRASLVKRIEHEVILIASACNHGAAVSA